MDSPVFNIISRKGLVNIIKMVYDRVMIIGWVYTTCFL